MHGMANFVNRQLLGLPQFAIITKGFGLKEEADLIARGLEVGVGRMALITRIELKIEAISPGSKSVSKVWTCAARSSHW